MEGNRAELASEQQTIDARAAINDAIIAAFFPVHRRLSHEEAGELTLLDVGGDGGEEENSHQYAAVKRRHVEGQRKNAQLNEELKLSNQWNEKNQKVKRLYQAEQKLTAQLRKKLKEKERDATSEKQASIIWLDDADHQQSTNEGNDAVSSLPCEDDGTVNIAANVVVAGVFKCAHCPPDRVAFSSAHLLAHHQRRFHANRQHWRHQCQQCDRSFQFDSRLKRHMRVHSGEKPFKCQECGKDFALKSILKRHSRVLHTGERPYLCAICEKAFATQGDLTRHARRHSDIRSFSCQHCAKQFKSPSNCRQHEKRCPTRPQSTAE